MDWDVKTLAYAAGIIDGEGCIYITKSWHGSRYRHLKIGVEVSCTSLNLIEWLSIQFGGYLSFGKRPNRKPYYRWGLSSACAAEFLQAIYPYLVIKREQAEVVFRFRSTLTRGGLKLSDNVVAIREDCYRSLKTLKRTG
jgi:hypothetical protein